MRIPHQPFNCKDVIKNKDITSYMSKMINDTDKDQKERFFKICAKDSQIRATKHCVGDECGVIPKADCKHGEITIGWFHTHIKPGEERLSSSDIMYGLDKDFSCVGFKKEDKNMVLCFDYPYSIPWDKIEKSKRSPNIDIFSTIDSILKKGIKRDCEEILD